MTDRRRWGAALAGLLALALAPVAAPNALAADTTEAEEAEDDAAKFFLFHAGDESADQFRGDLVYCLGQTAPIIAMRDRMPSTGGLLGGMINARMAEIDRLRMRNAAMRKCMGQFGYARFAVPQDSWKRIVKEGDIVFGNDNRIDPEVVEAMVAFAAGPVPATERLDR